MRSLASRLNVHFVRCAAIATSLGSGGERAAATVHWQLGVNINIPSNISGVYLNVVTGAFGASASQVPGWTINPWGYAGLSFWISTSPTSTQHIMRTGGGAVARLADSDIVGPSTIYGGWSNSNLDAAITGNQPFVPFTTNHYGFRFLYNGGVHYGWAAIHVGSSLSAQRRTLVDYAWED